MLLCQLSCLLMVCACSYADTLRLKSGRTVEGTYLGGDSRNIRFDNGDRIQTYSINDVAELRFGSVETSNSAPLAPEPAVAPRASAAPTPPRTATPAKAPAPARASSAGVEIPQGTPLVLRMIDDIDSSRDTVGQEFRASVDESVSVGERVVIPRGADVVVKLVEDKQSGKLSGRTELTLDVISVMVNGRMVDVRTDEVNRASESRTGKTGQVVGGTAALGAIIGAIAGGGKGAAIGAVTGAAAGGAVQVMTKGEKVKIPSETRLTFTLQQPLRI
ncbi:MAG TPA: hypothetical protein VER03_10860 [Bryobacteraceae bacterium]|nr:hypothetical protein [Bryobacteraceae bacterium]